MGGDKGAGRLGPFHRKERAKSGVKQGPRDGLTETSLRSHHCLSFWKSRGGGSKLEKEFIQTERVTEKTRRRHRAWKEKPTKLRPGGKEEKAN